jgi:ABC-type nitrate/sulfonate/bicarbonate transport system ATPase subunit
MARDGGMSVHAVAQQSAAASLVGEGGGSRKMVVNGLHKVFDAQDGVRIPALEDINIHIDTGEFVSVVGPSGCGKSTLLRIICGLEPATRGSVLVSGVQVTKPRKDVGVVFQSALLLPWFTMKDNVLMPLGLRQRRQPEPTSARTSCRRWPASRPSLKSIRSSFRVA